MFMSIPLRESTYARTTGGCCLSSEIALLPVSKVGDPLCNEHAQVSKSVSTAEAAAQAEAEAKQRNKAGLDSVLASLQAAKKVNVLDKSRSDWREFKTSDTKVTVLSALWWPCLPYVCPSSDVKRHTCATVHDVYNQLVPYQPLYPLVLNVIESLLWLWGISVA